MARRRKRRTFLTQRMGDGWLWVVSISLNVSGGGWAGKGQYKRNNCCEVRSCNSIIFKIYPNSPTMKADRVNKTAKP